jgi:hypothetical protein
MIGTVATALLVVLAAGAARLTVRALGWLGPDTVPQTATHHSELATSRAARDTVPIIAPPPPTTAPALHVVARAHALDQSGLGSYYPDLKVRIAQMRASGVTLAAIARQLYRVGMPTARGGAKRWRDPSSSVLAAAARACPRHGSRGGWASARGSPVSGAHAGRTTPPGSSAPSARPLGATAPGWSEQRSS